jgi:CBS domain-containing protein
MNMGDDRVSDGCIENGNAGWIDNKEAFPSGHQFPPRFPGCRCGCGSRVGDRKERSGLPDDRWIVTRQGDRVIVKPNPKYKDGYDKPVKSVKPDNTPEDLLNKIVKTATAAIPIITKQKEPETKTHPQDDTSDELEFIQKKRVKKAQK